MNRRVVGHPLFWRFHLPIVLCLTFAARMWELRR